MKKLVLLSLALISQGTIRPNVPITELRQGVNLSSKPTEALHQIFYFLSQVNGNGGDVSFTPLEELLQKGANPVWIGSNGLAVIHMAAKIGFVSSFPLIHCIKDKGNGLDHPDNNGMSALCHAAANGHGRFMEILIIHGGADPNFISPKTGQTPLHFATMNGEEYAAWDLMIQYDTQIRADNFGKVPADYANSELMRKLRDLQLTNKRPKKN